MARAVAGWRLRAVRGAGGGGAGRGAGLGVAAGAVAATAVLLVAGRGPLAPPPASLDGARAWLEDRGPVVAAAALVRLAALAGAGWVAAVTATAAALRLAGAARAAAAVELALPRRLRAAGVAAAVGVAGVAPFAAVVPAAPAAAAEPVAAEPAAPGGTARLSVLPGEPADAAPTSAWPAPSPAPLPAPEPEEPEEWVVAPGESFWSIAEEVVAEALGREPSEDEVRRYWVALIDANRGRLVTADPDLLLPGQRLRLV